MLSSQLFLHSYLLVGAIAATVDIDVGNGGLVFSPDTATAAVGDELHFHFHPQNHSVIEGSFTDACNPAGSGFFSGFMSVASGEGVSSAPFFHSTLACSSSSSPLVSWNWD